MTAALLMTAALPVALMAVPYLACKFLEGCASSNAAAANPGKRPWWRAGGMRTTQHISAVLIIVPACMLVHPLLQLDTWAPFAIWLAYGLLWFAASLPSSFIHGPEDAPVVSGGAFDFYAACILPVYQMSLVAGALHWWYLPRPAIGGIGCIALALMGFGFKVGVCMSVCLHRFAAHAAFKAGPVGTFLLCWLGCMGNQGGPIWWGSQHRVHHKFCDQPRDPHSSRLDGVLAAFVFFTFSRHQDVEEEFAPPHLESLAIRLLDTFSSIPVLVEYVLMYQLGGLSGLWISFVSGWLCQTICLWFNIVNHPPQGHSHAGGVSCDASDVSDGASVPVPHPYLRFLNRVLFITDVVGEEAHLHHHDHPRCALRPGLDLPGKMLVTPLHALGLITQLQPTPPMKRRM